MPIYRYFPGYADAKQRVQAQSLEDDLTLIDDLLGRDNLNYGDGPAEVKAEALRQLEIEYRDRVDERATFHVDVARAMLKR